MNISYNWLSQYLSNIPSPQEVADKLTLAGLEEESIASVGDTFEGLVVGWVKEHIQHPNADKLSLCQVDLGNEIVQIVCGAPNVAAGQKVPVATIGTKLMLPDRENPNQKAEITIKKGKLRGEESNGMICSAAELGLSNDHSGIMVLAESAIVGQQFSAYLQQQGLGNADTCIELNVTPNRPDATSHIGVARDVAALTSATLIKPEIAEVNVAEPDFEVSIECDTCHHFVGLRISGVTVGDSPDWLKNRLESIGLRPISNIVDITNFVMMECGQPLHAFDFAHIQGAKIRVQQTQSIEKFVTLDDKERELPIGTMMICDANRRVAVAGVMGGQNSEVSAQSTEILLEAAYFDPSNIRKTAKSLGLQSDASYRFERGIDADGQEWAIRRAAKLIVEIAGGKIGAMVKVRMKPAPNTQVAVRFARINQVIGTDVPAETVEQLLNAIEIRCEAIEGGLFCKIPTFRPDIEREIDVIEEVARLYGLDNVPAPTHTKLPNRLPHFYAPDVLRNRIRNTAVALGFRETFTNSMLKTEVAQQFGENIVETLNPISAELTALRSSLLPNVLKVVAFNQNHKQSSLNFFEIGHVFQTTTRTDVLVEGYLEEEHLLLVRCGEVAEASWNQSKQNADFFGLKGVLEALLSALQLPALKFKRAEAVFGSEVLFDVYSGKRKIGSVGVLDKSIAKSFEIALPVYFSEIKVDALLDLSAKQPPKRFVNPSKFPKVDRDLAFVVDKSVAAEQILQLIQQTGTPLLQKVRLFDVYEGDRIASDKKSLAFGLELVADRTLTDKEIDQTIQRILKRVEKETGAVLR